jgi:hypothetical protein
MEAFPVTKVRILMKQIIRRLAPIVVGGGVLLLSVPAAADGPFQFNTLTPCRVFDTRNVSGPTSGSPLVDNTTQTFAVQGICGIPVGAKAVTVNITAVSPTAQGHFRLYPSGLTLPTVSTLNFPAGSSALANGAIVPLADQTLNPEDLSVYTRVVGGGTAHIILDVTGYFQ